MAHKIFVTGTGTDVGKTYVTGLIVKKLHEAGLNAGYFKAAVSGNDRDSSGNLIPGDAKFVKDISGISQPLETMCPYIYERAVSPHLASRIEGNPVRMDVVKARFSSVVDTYDYVTMEGSGGILCPISYDDEKIMLEDVIKELGLSTILIADAGLGTINSVVLTVEYMRNKKIPVKAIIFNNYIEGDVMQEDNLKMCEEMTGLKVIAKVKYGATDIDIDIDTLINLYE
ncbi:MAG: dethiobiotin synthase [Saccharofermentans sp.]|nr:dethiobiotin synthase [Saccharofermentans sp.]